MTDFNTVFHLAQLFAKHHGIGWDSPNCKHVLWIRRALEAMQ